MTTKTAAMPVDSDHQRVPGVKPIIAVPQVCLVRDGSEREREREETSEHPEVHLRYPPPWFPL
jgi:hypothetical protein